MSLCLFSSVCVYFWIFACSLPALFVRILLELWPEFVFLSLTWVCFVNLPESSVALRSVYYMTSQQFLLLTMTSAAEWHFIYKTRAFNTNTNTHSKINNWRSEKLDNWQHYQLLVPLNLHFYSKIQDLDSQIATTLLTLAQLKMREPWKWSASCFAHRLAVCFLLRVP